MAFLRNVFRASLVASAAALAGCATTQGPEEGEGGSGAVPAAESADAPAAAVPAPAAAAAVSQPANAPAPASQPTNAPAALPAPKPKPWKCDYSAGRTLAKLDGVSVYLAKPAVSDWKRKSVSPAPLDAKLTVAPLVSARSTPLVSGRPMRVCLDPGHGGTDSGAVSKDGKTAEKTVALDIAKRVAKKLRADGFEVLLTRTDDETALELSERVEKSYRWRADAFVSIHLNSESRTGARGIETYAFPAMGMESTAHAGKATVESKTKFHGNGHDVGNVQLAYCIQRRLVRAAGTKTEDRGFRRARWIVLRDARAPATLVECGFVSSPSDLAWLRTESGRETVARGIYEGICDFAFGTMAPGLPARTPPPARPAAPARTAQPAAAAQPAAPSAAGASSMERVSAPPPERPLDKDPSVRAAREAALRAAGLLPAESGKPASGNGK